VDHESVQLDSPRIRLVDAIESRADGVLVDPELAGFRRPVALLFAVARDELEQQQRRSQLVPQDVGSAHLPVAQWWHVGDVEPVGSDRLGEGRSRETTVIDTAILADAIMTVRMAVAQPGPEGLRQEDALRVLQKV